MTNPTFDHEKAHRWFAIEWNNTCWSALEATTPPLETQESTLHQAHASLAHWRHAGNDVNWVRALCLVANVEARFGASESAMRFAERAQELASRTHDLADWDHAFLADAMMRALSAGASEERRRDAVDTQRLQWLESSSKEQKERAQSLGDAIANEEERDFFFAWFRKENNG